MRIGYFGRPIGLTGGIGRYAQQLLATHLRTAPGHQFLVYTNRDPASVPEGATVRVGPRRLGRVLWEQAWLSAQLAKDRLDVYHGTDFTLPLASRQRSVLNVHDLIFLRETEGTSVRARLLYSTLARISARKARLVITLSDFTARDLHATLGIPQSKLRSIPLAAKPDLKDLVTDEEARQIVQKLGITRPYVLFVGLITPRKGVLTLIDAFGGTSNGSSSAMLVLVGLPGAGFDIVQDRMKESPRSAQILQPKGVDDRALAALYNQASVFCLPSHHEGFGLPVVEAMSFGTPVLASDGTALPEVVGDGGLCIPSDDVHGWAAQISRLLVDSDYAAEMSARARERAAHFSWDRTSRETVAVYQEAMEGA